MAKIKRIKKGNAEFIVKDYGFEQINKNLAAIGAKMLAVGIQGSEAAAKHSDGEDLTNVEIGVIHEFGAPNANIPERSFLRATVDRESDQIKKLSLNLAKKTYDGDKIDPKKQIGMLGEFVKGKIVETFDNSIGLAALEAETIDRKGSSRPLIDTGQLKGSITWVIK